LKEKVIINKDKIKVMDKENSEKFII